VVPAFGGIPAYSTDWTVEYTGDVLPEDDGWVHSNAGPCMGVASVGDGALTLNTTTCDAMYYYYIDWDETNEWTCEVGVQEEHSEYAPDIPAGMNFTTEHTRKQDYYNSAISILFYRSTIEIYAGFGTVTILPINNWLPIRYRFCLRGNTLEVYKTVPGSGYWQKIYDEIVEIYEGTAPPGTRISFGKTANSHLGGISHWDYVAYKSGYDPPPFRVPSLSEWALLILTIVIITSALWIYRVKLSKSHSLNA